MPLMWTDEDLSDQQSELATQLRIPILKSFYPRWNYVTGVVVEKWFDVYEGVMPTDDELVKIAEWLEQYNQYYNQRYLNEMKEFAPYDIDGGANFHFLIKYADGTWGHKKPSWQGHAWPLPLLHPEHYGKTLDEILDKTRANWGRWARDAQKKEPLRSDAGRWPIMPGGKDDG